eukprot:3940452-Rhodomonas_salina.1
MLDAAVKLLVCCWLISLEQHHPVKGQSYTVKETLLKFDCVVVSPRERDNVPLAVFEPVLSVAAFEGLDICGSFNATNLFTDILTKYKYSAIETPVNAAAFMTEEDSSYFRCK